MVNSTLSFYSLIQFAKIMLNRLRKFFETSPSHSPQVHRQNSHDISNDDISHNALKVIDKLQQAGYAAYLVGGGVRDLLLGERPKDFDVATDATPEQVSSVFRNGRIIGKRFRIVHVRFGREIIEVTTFRGNHEKASKKNEAVKSEKGILLRDNVYGDIESDAIRRDFTINALYYDPKKSEILDFTGGVKDLESRTLQIIGDPDARYKEDPVRMLRAVRFAAKLGFSIEAATEAPIHEHSEYLSDIPAARLFEEVLKLFMSGYATAVLNKLREFGLLTHLFPGADKYLELGEPFDTNLVMNAATNTDKRIRRGKRVTPAFIYATMLWLPLRHEMKRLIDEQKMSPYDAMQLAAQGIISQQLAVTSIPKRFLIPMREIWTLQLRLDRREGRRAHQMMEHQRFRAAYDFLLLREDSGEQLDGLGLWWTNFQDADDEEKEVLIKSAAPKGKRKPRRHRRSRSNKGNTLAATDSPAQGSDDAPQAD